MKRLLLAATTALLAATAHAETLLTPSFSVQIEVNCAEGNVSCDDVSYRGQSRKSGQSIALRGRTLHRRCADGVTPCRFLGYEFRRGATRYQVLEGGELIVTQGGKLLLHERGDWQ